MKKSSSNYLKITNNKKGGKLIAFKKIRPREKVCIFCKNKNQEIDYKDVELLKRFISPNDKISPSRVTDTCAKFQRAVEQSIKRARFMALLPYVIE